MGVHEPNFRLVFEWRSPVRAYFELHMEVPIAEADTSSSSEVERLTQEAMELAGYLNDENWTEAARFVSDRTEDPTGKEVIQRVFEIRSGKEAS